MELDFIHAQSHKGKTPKQIHAMLVNRRTRRNVAAPDLTNVRKALKGFTYKRGLKETRGRKVKYSKKWVTALTQKRKELIKKAQNDREVRWRDVVKAARAPKGHRSTVKRAFDGEMINVAARRPREKPQRTKERLKERVDYCSEWGGKDGKFFVHGLDMIRCFIFEVYLSFCVLNGCFAEHVW